MCFTISYGLLHFPEAGILDAAQESASTTGSQTVHVMKQTTDGTPIQVEETSFTTALPETQTPSKNLFETQSDSTSKSDSANSDNASSSEKDSSKSADNASAAKSPKTKSESKAKKAKSDSAKQPSKENKKSAKENKSEKTESDAAQQPAPENAQPAPENQSNNETEEQDNSQLFIEAPGDDDFIPDESLPIESDINPMPPMVDTTESDIPPIIVDDSLSLEEQNAAPITEPDIPEEEPIQVPDLPEDDSQAVKEKWENYITEDGASKNMESNNSPIDSTSTSEADQIPAMPEPPVIQSDPNAQEIPPRNREMKAPNKDAFTQPAINEQQNNFQNPNRQNTGTIPLETFPIDSAANDPAAMQRVNYTVDCQQEPYDPFGFKVPIIGPIVVRRLPSVDNSVDPIYDNAQLDRFAL